MRRKQFQKHQQKCKRQILSTIQYFDLRTHTLYLQKKKSHAAQAISKAPTKM